MALISVKFKKQCGQYNAGELAGFTAEQLAQVDGLKRPLIPPDAYDLVEAEKPAEEPAAPAETPTEPPA